MRKLEDKQPKYANAVLVGLIWNVIPHQVEDMFGALMDLLQEAGNRAQKRAQEETRFEIILKIHARAKGILKANADIDEAVLWERVSREALRGDPSFKDEVPDFLKFVKHLSGGLADAKFLTRLRDFSRTLPQPRVVKGNVLATLATIQIGGVDAAPRVRIACIEAMMSCSATYVHGANEQKLLTTSDISFLAGKLKSFAIDAECLLLQVDEICKTLSSKCSEHADKIKYSSYLCDVRVVHHMFRKKDETRGSFNSIQAIGHAFITEVSTMTKQSFASPWKPKPKELAAATSAAAASAAAAAAAVTTAKRTGGLVSFAGADVSNRSDMLAEKGFKVGVPVTRKNDPTKALYVITAVTSETSTLTLQGDDDDEEMTVFHDAFIKGTYKIAPGTALTIEEIVDNLSGMSALETFEWRYEMIKAKLVFALNCHARLHDQFDGLVIVRRKGLRATRQFARGALQLVPVSPNFQAKPKSEKLGDASIDTNNDLGSVVTGLTYKVELHTDLPATGAPR